MHRILTSTMLIMLFIMCIVGFALLLMRCICSETKVQIKKIIKYNEEDDVIESITEIV